MKLCILTLLIGGALAAQEVRTLKVQGNVYLLSGAGGNVVVQAGEEGVVVVDTGAAGRSDALLAAIRKLSDKPMQFIVNTNMHPDFIGEPMLLGT
jgi:cyclase